MHREDPDHPVEDDDRRREHGEAVEAEQRLTPAEVRVAELGGGGHVPDCDRASLTGGEVRHRESAGSQRVDRLETRTRPLGCDRHRVTRIAQPD